MSMEASGPAIHHGHICCDAHFVDVPSCVNVVERIEDNLELLEEGNIKLRILDICVIGFDLDIRVESAG